MLGIEPDRAHKVDPAAHPPFLARSGQVDGADQEVDVAIIEQPHRRLRIGGLMHRLGAEAVEQPPEQFAIQIARLGYQKADFREIDRIFRKFERHDEYVV